MAYGSKVCPQATQPHCWCVVTWMALGLLSCYLVLGLLVSLLSLS